MNVIKLGTSHKGPGSRLRPGYETCSFGQSGIFVTSWSTNWQQVRAKTPKPQRRFAEDLVRKRRNEPAALLTTPELLVRPIRS
jgi:hypothetical protein